MLRLASLTVLLLVAVSQGKGERRSLSEMRYHFTPCGKTGRMGPSYQDCVDYYTSISSPIIRDSVLTDTHSSVFIGSQSFRAPRATVYNVTIAGAAGGRGLCNSEYGRGLVQHGRYTLDTDLDYLILVGQRGLGPCDTGEPDPGHMLCQNHPQNLEENTNCNEAYHQWLMTLSGTDADRTFTFSGGAGGGGASFLGFRDSRPFADIRVFGISGGGGGSSGLLNYSVIRDLLPQLNTSSENDSVLYTEQLDSRPYTRDNVLGHPEGVRGYKVESDVVTAGAGGGSFGSVDYPTSQEDGKIIGLAEDFAIGGTHCARSDFSGIPLQLRKGDGGFGGGGGGCGGGGGGGGYTGGSIIGDTNTAPGGGGYSFDGTTCQTQLCSVPFGSYSYSTEGDGYVDIVAADCGCVYECVVYEEEDQFQCLCPNDTQIAPDLSDCYYSEEKDMEVYQFESVGASDIAFKGIIFGNSTFIFSVNVSLSTSESRQRHQSTSEGDRCVMMFVGGDNNIVLATNPVIGSGTVTSLSEVSLNLTSGTLTMTDYTSFLNSSVLVTGAMLASTGECEIGDMAAFNVSVVQATAVPANFSNLTPLDGSVASQLLQLPLATESVTLQEPIPTESVTLLVPTDDSATGQDAFIPVVASLSAVVVILAVLLAAIVMTKWLRAKKKKDSHSENIPMELNRLTLNSAYGVATNEDPYHLYETIPDVPREYEVPIKDSKLLAPIQIPTHDDESEQKDDVEGSSNAGSDYYVNDVQGSDGDSDYYVNDP